jgi:hypothetical protein
LDRLNEDDGNELAADIPETIQRRVDPAQAKVSATKKPHGDKSITIDDICKTLDIYRSTYYRCLSPDLMAVGTVASDDRGPARAELSRGLGVLSNVVAEQHLVPCNLVLSGDYR